MRQPAYIASSTIVAIMSDSEDPKRPLLPGYTFPSKNAEVYQDLENKRISRQADSDGATSDFADPSPGDLKSRNGWGPVSRNSPSVITDEANTTTSANEADDGLNPYTQDFCYPFEFPKGSRPPTRRRIDSS